jgi:8-oxo-dGTP diphosphatase
VLAGVLRDAAGRVLVTQRPPGRELAGSWEFPGGKRADDEPRFEALHRELAEELGIRVAAARPLIRYLHRYPAADVDLDVWQVDAWDGEPRGLEGQALDWRPPADLVATGLLPADRPVVSAIVLPDRVLVSPPGLPADALRSGLAAADPPLAVLRASALADEVLLEFAREETGRGRRVVLHGDPDGLAAAVASGAAAGLHLPARALAGLRRRPVPRERLLGASCHDRRELERAAGLGADYAFLGAVRATPSHPDRAPLGWQGFAALVADLPLPVFGIGGLSVADLPDAWAAGAQGIAGIRGLWPGA